MGKRAGHARIDACAGLNFSLGAKFFCRSRWGDQLRFLSLPYWAGSSTLALGPGCCGFVGPVPSATLDKRCRKGSSFPSSKRGNWCQEQIAVFFREKNQAQTKDRNVLPEQTFHRVHGGTEDTESERAHGQKNTDRGYLCQAVAQTKWLAISRERAGGASRRA